MLLLSALLFGVNVALFVLELMDLFITRNSQLAQIPNRASPRAHSGKLGFKLVVGAINAVFEFDPGVFDVSERARFRQR